MNEKYNTIENKKTATTTEKHEYKKSRVKQKIVPLEYYMVVLGELNKNKNKKTSPEKYEPKKNITVLHIKQEAFFLVGR